MFWTDWEITHQTASVQGRAGQGRFIMVIDNTVEKKTFFCSIRNTEKIKKFQDIALIYFPYDCGKKLSTKTLLRFVLCRSQSNRNGSAVKVWEKSTYISFLLKNCLIKYHFFFVGCSLCYSIETDNYMKQFGLFSPTWIWNYENETSRIWVVLSNVHLYRRQNNQRPPHYETIRLFVKVV